MLAELSQGRSCGQTARGGRGTVCRVEFSYPERATVTTSRDALKQAHFTINGSDGKIDDVRTSESPEVLLYDR